MFTPPQSAKLQAIKTPIPGLLLFDLDIRGDARGWFKENWQRDKMTKLGLPDFGPIQNNFSSNNERGVLRGIHAEPWDKFISLGSGKVFCAWVDLREGDSFGTVFTTELDPAKAVYVPAGVANSYLTLEDNTVYAYLVNDHWYPDAQYTFVNAADPSLKIDWPIPPEECERSDKDKNHQMLADVQPIKPKKILVTGANGQVGRALKTILPDAEFVTREEFDIADPAAYEGRNWREYQAIINAAAYNAVDAAEEDIEGVWKVNASAVQLLAKTAAANNLTLVHFSTDYVFSSDKTPHTEDEPFSPKSKYASSKAAGDLAAATSPKHYILRVSWVIGDGKNFVRTMQTLAEKGIKPSVVDDQTGRLTFADDIAAAVKYLLESESPFGTYNLSNEGDVVSWAEIAKEVLAHSGKSGSDVTGTTTAAYFADKPTAAPRPLKSEFSLEKIKATGFMPRDWREALAAYITEEK